MNTYTHNLLKILMAAALMLAMVAPTAFAQSVQRTQLNTELTGDFVVEPGKRELVLNPGEVVTRNVSITNRYEETVTFAVEIEDLEGSENPDQTVILLGEETGPYSIKDLVSPAVSEFTLAPGERITIPVTISIPVNADPGGRYGALLFSNAPSKNADGVSEGSRTRVISRLGSLLLVRVAGDIEESGVLEDFRLSGEQKVFYGGGPFTFEILFRNSGNVHLTPYGYIRVKNLLGQSVGEIPVDAYFALPESLRYRQITWDKGVLFGRYTAELNFSRGYDGLADTETLTFWVIPWKLIAIVGAIVLIIFFILRFLGTRFEFRLRRKDSGEKR